MKFGLWILLALGLMGVAACTVRAAKTPEHSGRIKVEKVITPLGIEVWLIHENSHPVIALEASFIGGSAEDPVGQEGAAEALADMLTRGAGQYDEVAFDERLDDLRMGIDTTADEGRIHLSARMLSAERDAGFDLVRLVLTQPRFDAEALRRYREQMSAALKQRETNPNWIAARTLKEAVLADHPTSRIVTMDSLSALDDETLREVAKTLLTRFRLQIVVTGDVDAKTLAAMIDKTFGDLPAGPKPEAIPMLKPEPLNRVFLKALPQPQSLFSMVAAGPDRNDADFFPLLVGLEILGGDGLSSRLNKRLREDMGLTYGVSLNYDLSPHGVMIAGGGLTQNTTAGAAVHAFRKEIERFSREGPTEEEMEDTKRYLVGSFVLDFDSSFALASRLSYYRYLGRDADYINQRNAKIEAVTREQVQAAARKWFDPHHFTVAVVGVPEGLEPGSPFAP